MANFLGVQQETMQHALLTVPSGRSLVIYVTALAAAETSVTVRGLLREHLAVTLGLSQVGEIPKNIYHACVHPHTLQLLQKDIATNFERCKIAFSAVDTGQSKAASYRDLAVISMTFAKAQRSGPKYFVRVKNLVGAEALCAVLGVAFNADVTVGFMHAVVPPVRAIIGTASRSTPSTNAEAALSPNTPSSSDFLPTVICFEYDTSGVAAIGLCETGGPVRDYIIPKGEAGKLSRNSMLIGQILPSAKLTLDKMLSLSWVCKAGMASYQMNGWQRS
jgi:hypothetical protein